MADREDVIKGLECLSSDEVCYGSDCPHYDFDCTQEIAQDVLNLLKEQEPIVGWISVKDRLPERYERILTYDKYSGVKENWLLKSDPCVSWSYGFHVTHWMPLPEPPEGNKDAVGKSPER